MRRTMVVAVGLLALLAGCRRGETPTPPAAPVAAGQPPATPPPSADMPTGVATVYFATSDLAYLEPEARDVAMTTDDTPGRARAAVEALLDGPAEEGHVRLVPEGTRLNGLNLEAGIAAVDLSAEFTRKFTGGSNAAQLAVDSLVDTVCELQGIEQVQILVEGKQVDDLGGHVGLREPLKADRDVIGGAPLSSLQDDSASGKAGEEDTDDLAGDGNTDAGTNLVGP